MIREPHERHRQGKTGGHMSGAPPSKAPTPPQVGNSHIKYHTETNRTMRGKAEVHLAMVGQASTSKITENMAHI